MFYKDFKNHIELVNFDPFGYYRVNTRDKSWLVGIELEGKKHIFFLAEYSRYYDRSLPEFIGKYLNPTSSVDSTFKLRPSR